MPAMLRPNKKLEKIAFDILGKPANKVERKRLKRKNRLPSNDYDEVVGNKPQESF